MLLRPRQKVFVERCLAALRKHQNTLGIAFTGCHAKGTQVLMFDGSLKAVEDVQVGDKLMGPDSTPRCVLRLCRGEDHMYEIKPIKGSSFVVNQHHVLSLVHTKSSDIVNLSVQDYLARGHGFKHLHKLYRVAVDFPSTNEPDVDSYFLGLLLGDGSLKHGTPSITTADFEVADYCYGMAEQLGMKIREDQLPGNEANTYYFIDPNFTRNRLVRVLKNLGLREKCARGKFIPDSFKLGSRKTRAAVLAGLIDTDGYNAGKCIEFCTASEQLANDVAFVARSLGLAALPKAKKVNGEIYYRFSIYGDFSTIPLRVGRRIPGERKQKKNPLRTGFTVHALDWGPYFGFTVNKDHLYLLDDFTVTHNSGKTVMFSGLIGDYANDADTKACVLAHRQELTQQNESKFKQVNPDITTSVFDAQTKSWQGQTNFAMVQTLSQPRHLAGMPSLDLLVIDEAHHSCADSYKNIIDAAKRKNPDVLLFGVTATPARSDTLNIRDVFTNVADHITLGELIRSGHLVKPVAKVIDIGTQDKLSDVKHTADDFDMREVERIMNKQVLNDVVVKHWKEQAGDRQTIVFCSTREHARDVTKAFQSADVSADHVHGAMSDTERRKKIKDYEAGRVQVMVNVAILTEGYDHPPTGCVVLLRPSSHKSTLIQMIGRGLRTVDPAVHPGITKTDCVVLDFGTSLLMHQNLKADLDDIGHDAKGPAPQKDCPSCLAKVLSASMVCPLCGYQWSRPADDNDIGAKEKGVLDEFTMTELDLFAQSSFLWVDLFQGDETLAAQGFEAWAVVLPHAGVWFTVGGLEKTREKRLLQVGTKTQCIAAGDDWLNEWESTATAHKTKDWLNLPPTEKQRNYLPSDLKAAFGLTRYHAACLLSYRFNLRGIRQVIQQFDEDAAA